MGFFSVVGFESDCEGIAGVVGVPVVVAAGGSDSTDGEGAMTGSPFWYTVLGEGTITN